MNRNEVERMAVMEQKVTDIGKSLDNHAKEQREDFKTISEKLDSLGSNFAGKWVEKVAIGSVATLVASLVTLFVYLI